jgi:hypothetical protein
MASPQSAADAVILAKRLREVLDYNPGTGVFVWRINRPRARVGNIAGSVHPLGYRVIAIDKKDYYAHKLAWFWMTGVWPAGEVDHRDLNKDHNAWLNLRSATRSQNCANKKVPESNLLGIKGVRLERGKYRARSYAKRKCVSLGSFDTAEEARLAVITAGKANFGEFYHVD